MIKTAGKTLCPRNIARMRPEEVCVEIRISWDFFARYGLLEGTHKVCGIDTTSSAEALLLVFEHEVCHAYEFIRYFTSSCKGKRFRALALSMFGHKESYHKLPTNHQVASSKYGLQLGCKVSFLHSGQVMLGILYKVNKRATVMVKDKKGSYTDKKGSKYSKYYVPLELLKRQVD
jgi:hypothetical protein